VGSILTISTKKNASERGRFCACGGKILSSASVGRDLVNRLSQVGEHVAVDDVVG
jgi:hypothetical protein